MGDERTELHIELYPGEGTPNCPHLYWVWYTPGTSPERMALDFEQYCRWVQAGLTSSDDTGRLLDSLRAASLDDFAASSVFTAGVPCMMQESVRRSNPSVYLAAAFEPERPIGITAPDGAASMHLLMSVAALARSLVAVLDERGRAVFGQMLRVMLGVSDGSAVICEGERALRAKRMSAMMESDPVVWFILPWMMDKVQPHRWVYGLVDQAINWEMTSTHHDLADEPMANGARVVAPELAAEWRWKGIGSRADSPIYTPRYLPDCPSESYLTLWKHSLIKEYGGKYLGIASSIITGGRELTLDDLSRVSLEHHVFASPERYTAYTEWLAEECPQYFTDPRFRIDAHYSVADYLMFDDPAEAESWIRPGNRLYLIDRDMGERVKKLLTVDWDVVASMLPEGER